MRTFICICLLCLLQAARLGGAPSGPIRSVDFPFAADLPSNEITDIFQDSSGFIWLGTTNGLARYDGYSLQTFRADFRHPDLLTNNHITCFEEDERYVWIGTLHGLNVFDKHTMTLCPYPLHGLEHLHIFSLRRTADGNLWIAGYDRLFRLNRESGHFTLFLLGTPDGQRVRYNLLSCDRDKRLWICSQQGLIRYDENGGRFVRYPQIGQHNNPFSLFQDKEGRYWIATWGDGLWQMLPGDGRTVFRRQPLENGRTHEPDERFFSITQDNAYGYLWVLSYNNLYTLRMPTQGDGMLEQVDIDNQVDINKMYTRIIKCHDGTLWLSSYDRGTIISFPQEKVCNYPLDKLSREMNWEPNLLTLCRDNEDNFWFNQDRFGICLRHAADGHLTYTPTELHDITIDSRVTTPHTTGKGIWFAHAFLPVVYHLWEEYGQIGARPALDLGQRLSIYQRIMQMEEDSSGRLWMLAGQRIMAWNDETNRLCSTPDTVGYLRFTLHADGKVWGATHKGTLHALRLTETNDITDRYVDSIPLSPHEEVRIIGTDHDRNLWFSTSQGRVLQYDTKNKHYTDLTETLNKEGTDILNLLADRNRLWIITHHKATLYNLDRKSVIEYGVPDDNFAVRIFRNQASYIAHDGTLFAGGNGGFMSVSSDNTHEKRTTGKANIILSDVKVEGRSIFFNRPERSTSEASDISHIRLTHKARHISIDFTDLSHLDHPRPRYAFLLEGTDEQWLTTSEPGEHSAFYNRIGKGRHALYVKSTDENGLFGEARLLAYIEVAPAWWETIWAYFAYALLTVFTVGAALRLYVSRLKAAGQRKLQDMMTRTRLDYITNVSHELLTPLTVISCIGDYWKKQYPNEKKQSDIMHNHIYRLRHLLQQVLDFRKAEDGKMSLKVRRGNITAFIRRTGPANFQPLAEQKHIRLSTDIPEEEIWGYLDFDKVDKILYNLISNAIKYTPENKNILFSAEVSTDCNGTRRLTLRVKDEGIGIPPKEQEHIFTRFYVGSNGQSGLSNGIGLSLTKNLTELHHGHIRVESKTGKGSVFTVVLPIDRTAYADEEIEKDIKDAPAPVFSSDSTTGQVVPDGERTVILLVDDNRDLLDTMKLLFENTYETVTAGNGQEALDILARTAPDLIVSDVMMPVMDGLEFCRRVKSTVETSHIPVILLTARQSADDKIEVYNAGADGYLAKPFETEVLRAKIDNLLKSFRKRQQTFRMEDHIRLGQLEYRSEDTHFLQSIADYIHAHLADEDCGLDQLAEHTHTSKSTLHRKVKAMTGLTPSDFVRNIKLKYACTLLLRSDCSISDAAYTIGFSSPKYFTKCFKKEFGITPTEYQQRKNTAKMG